MPDTPAAEGARTPPAPPRQRVLEALMNALAGHLSLDAQGARPITADLPFQGPNGLLCRIRTADHEAGLQARPELLLPLDRRQIGRIDVDSLLAVQSTLLTQLGWVLGQSAEGLLQLSPLSWTIEARELAQDLDMGSAVARMTMVMLDAPLPHDDRPHPH